jgi:hypothetical protein
MANHSRLCLISKGYPCGHALAVLLGQQKTIKDYVKSYFTVKYYGCSYAGAIVYLHTIDFAPPWEFNCRHSRSTAGLSNDEDDESDEPESTLLLNTRLPPGRLKNCCIRTRIKTTDAAPAKLQKRDHCQRLTADNKRKCKEPVVGTLVRAQVARASRGDGRGDGRDTVVATCNKAY